MYAIHQMCAPEHLKPEGWWRWVLITSLPSNAKNVLELIIPPATLPLTLSLKKNLSLKFTGEFGNSEQQLPGLLDSLSSVQFSRSVVSNSATPWTAAHQASLSITNSRSSRKLMSIASVMPSSHLILCCPLLLLPPIRPSIRVFSNESTLSMRWPKYWSYSSDSLYGILQ